MPTLVTLPDFQTTKLFGLEILAEPFAVWWPRFCQLLQTTTQPIRLFTPNPEILVQAYEDVSFYTVLKHADVLIPDGMGLVWASKWLTPVGQNAIPERVAGTDVVSALLDFSAKHHWRVLVVGGRDYVPSATAAPQLLAGLPGEVYWLPGFASVTAPTETETETLKTELQNLKPAMVFVAFGAPAQELWITQTLPELKTAGVKLAMSVGGAFDFLLGNVARAPKLLQVLGLEWIYRLARQPWRWRRQLKLIEFVKLAVAEKNQMPH